MTRFVSIASICVALAFATEVSAASLQERLVRQLRQQGFTQIEVTRTWLGRVRIEAEGRGAEREIVINPRTGEILRDFWIVEEEENDGALFSPRGDGGAGGLGSSNGPGGGSDDDDNADDADDADDASDDDEGDEDDEDDEEDDRDDD